ncbi:hypothetical protein A1O1_04726 [Capronia coronata CBS 617.96]|uniref:Uncharacterized protein n=1 Tax=Capronia coronata CBS 617.96 TaxID=1182541 RepID=W9YZS7_9EURO|nr:uncharacterized protein A1O1_04726 [Capronia coronata CBS 617.96]EXJ87799.1 hypothetical protein A1O1_04726 [Capronia coronata CBS 617.96]
MAWYSILPSHLTAYETWIIRAFLVLAIINIAPWIIAIVYDLIYYVGRRAWHEVPIWGGRARGQRRPRAPSLRDRTRNASIAEMIKSAAHPAEDGQSAGDGHHKTHVVDAGTGSDDEGDGEGVEGDT